MGLYHSLTLASCVGQLALAFLVLYRGGRTRIGWALSALCIDFFAFNAADVAGHFSSARGWVWLDSVAASMLTPLALHLLLIFVGRSRDHRVTLTLTYCYYGAVALVCAASFVLPEIRWFAGSDLWAIVLLAGSPPVLVLCPRLLAQHARSETSDAERSRTYLFIGAYAIATIGCASDLFADMGVLVPRLANVGTLACTLMLATIVLRFQLFERNVSYLTAVNAAVAGIVQILAYLAVFRFLGTNKAMLILGTVTVTLAIVPVLRVVLHSQAAHRQRLEYLATLGRFSAQMAHDLKNPLAAIKGAAQLLEGDTRIAPDSAEYVTLVLGQVERINRVISHYQRLGRLEVVREITDVNALAKEVVAHQSIAAGPSIDFATTFADGLAPLPLDRDLLHAALENVVRNAIEALPNGGKITITTEDGSTAGAGFVAIAVEDTGTGMNPRVSDHAFDDFFTTKSTGTGLGLPFVRRVAEAHGGDVTLHSSEGEGTIVRWRLRTS